MNMQCRVLVISIVSLATVVCSNGQLHHDSARISVLVPDGWNVNTLEQIREQSKIYEIPVGAPKPGDRGVLFKFTKYEEPTEKLNPTVHIVGYLLEDWMSKDPVKILEHCSVEATLPGSQWIDKPSATEFKDRRAAKASYKKVLVTKKGSNYVFFVRYWVIVRDADFIGVKMSGAEQGPDRCDGEFAAILQSIVVD